LEAGICKFLNQGTKFYDSLNRKFEKLQGRINELDGIKIVTRKNFMRKG
jgi:hypothetical protein